MTVRAAIVSTKVEVHRLATDLGGVKEWSKGAEEDLKAAADRSNAAEDIKR